MEMLIKFLGYLIGYLKDLTIDCDYDTNDDGSVSCWTESPHVSADVASTLEESFAMLPELLRQWAYEYIENYEYYFENWPDDLPYVLKILLSSDEEIKSCLRCDDTTSPDIDTSSGIPF